jgi:hypothetical protein
MIGVLPGDAYAVEETFQLLKIPWEWYNPARVYDAVIGPRAALDGLPGTSARIPDMNLFQQVGDLLNRGEDHHHEPTCEILIDSLRNELKRVTMLVEIPPVPWGFSSILAVTHDVDVMTVRERPLLSVAYAVFQCFRKGWIGDGLRILFAKAGWGRDPWNSLGEWMALEEEMGIRSTFYIIPFRGRAGLRCPPIRASGYEPNRADLDGLIRMGWEAGIHGIDAWVDPVRGREERQVFSDMGIDAAGHRTHWLLWNEETWRNLDQAGFSYDSTFGYNEDVGFRAGTLQVYRPRTAPGLLELPLHIQDLALFGKFCWLPKEKGWQRVPCLDLDTRGARARCSEILTWAQRFGGVVTLLWHHESLAPPRRWGEFFRILVDQARAQGAWVSRAQDAVAWFRMRRDVQIRCEQEGGLVRIRLHGLASFEGLPPLTLRIHISGERVAEISRPWVHVKDYVDIRCDREEIMVRLR